MSVEDLFVDQLSEKDAEIVNKVLRIPKYYEYITSICGWYVFINKKNDDLENHNLEKYLIFDRMSEQMLFITEQDIIPLKHIMERIDDVNDFNHAIKTQEYDKKCQ